MFDNFVHLNKHNFLKIKSCKSRINNNRLKTSSHDLVLRKLENQNVVSLKSDKNRWIYEKNKLGYSNKENLSV